MTFLPTSYVRSHRRRWQLSQRELALLLGFTSQAVVSQHESLARLPQTKVLLKYEILFGEPVGELFPKLRKEAEDEIVIQVKALMQKLENRTDISTARKLELLTNLMRRIDV